MSEAALRTRRGLLLGAGMLAGATAGRPAMAAAASPKGVPAADFRIARVTATAISTRDTFDYGGVRKPTRGAATYVEVQTQGGLVGHGITTIADSRGVA